MYRVSREKVLSTDFSGEYEQNVLGPKIHDARIAALRRDHAVDTLWSADRDFSRFRGLVVANPLVGGS